MNNTCLNNIIGITRGDNTALNTLMADTTLGNDWYKRSTSGFYLDELEGLVNLKAVDESKETTSTMANWFKTAIDNAILNVAKDFVIALNTKYKEAYQKYNGLIADNRFANSNLNVNSNYAGLRIITQPMKGGAIVINKLYVMMSAAATFNILIYKVERYANSYELVHTITNVTSIANATATITLTTPITLPLSEFGADYYFLYEPIGFMPKQNNLSCMCGAKELLLNNYLSFYGVQGNDIPMMPYFSTSNYANGLSLEVSVGCNTNNVVCAAYDGQEAFKAAMAFAVRYKAGELVHEYVMASNNINQYTLNSREFMWGKRNHFKKEYVDILNWLADNTDINVIDCYNCNDKRVTKSGLLV